MLAMWLKNIDKLIDTCGAIGCNSILFLFPALFYISSLRKYGSPHHRKECETIFYHVVAWCLLLFFPVNLFLYFYKLAIDMNEWAIIKD